MTVFERIIAREIPASIVWEDDRALVIRDLHPQAPIHLLVIPKKPLARVGEATVDDEGLLGHLLWVAGQAARVMMACEPIVYAEFVLPANNERSLALAAARHAAGEAAPESLWLFADRIIRDFLSGTRIDLFFMFSH